MYVIPHLFGERHQPSSLASIKNIGRSDLNVPGMMRSIASGIVENLRSMMESCYQEDLKRVTRVVACGSAVTRNPFVREAICKHVFPEMEVTVKENVDSANGAALSVM